MNICPDLCDGCLHNVKNNWCEEYGESCEDCYKNCRRNETVLSGDDIESQDDFMAWQMF